MSIQLTSNKLKQKAARRQDKRLKKKQELAEYALKTLTELGYANTSLRDIAEQSGVSVGTFHYYFEDKNDLILFCIDLYKDEFIQSLAALIDRSESPEYLFKNYPSILASFIMQSAHIHRLWYDIRSQSMFDDAFTDNVARIEAEFIDICTELLKGMKKPDIRPVDFYILVDGIYRYYLQQHLFGNEVSQEAIAESFENLMGTLGR